ncbi:UPF0481 protein At3g47200-like [Coffea eugenioides]|uniref:UPF0481 protein At3g47200-like n=1 Tax=Coffea eugenioides TaxID=49369 RepID=UPI000F604A07|nr:UPF0481 protein At3g47200-like [Coffea eugenioides]
MSTDARTVRISNCIHEKLSRLSDADIRAASNERCIFKVRERKQSQIEEPYEPQMVSIGPYHRGKPGLQLMEKYKLIYLKQLLDRTGERSLEICIEAMANLEGVAKRWYTDERISHDGDDDFVEMMLLDGCFILELVWKINHTTQSTNGILSDALFIDLLGIENQVPFFILVELFHKTNPNSGASSSFNNFAQRLTGFVIPAYGNKENEYVVDDDQVIHLLDLVYKACTSSFAAKFTTPGPRIGIPEADLFSLYHITSANELQEINGVKFVDSGKVSWLDITGGNGVVKIPCFMVHVDTERLLRNLIAYELHYVLHHKDTRWYICDYAIFMGRLINSARDVEVLRRSKIIINKLNDDQAVSTMFRRVTGDIYPGNSFCYADVFSELEKYAKSRRHVWWTKFRKTYFNTPWSPISFVAAVVALILTFLQTLYTIRSRPPR